MNNLNSHFLLDPSIAFLNFGSFGACPAPVLARYQELQRIAEKDPVNFFFRLGPQLLNESREGLERYLHCPALDLVYVPSPTFAVNLVAMNLELAPGDEILATDIEYGACDRAWAWHCRKKGAKYIRQKIHFPVSDPDEIVVQLFAGVTAKTKMIFVSHITSSTALILPVEKIIAAAKEKGLQTFIDGAHVSGHIPLDLSTLDCDYYTGACHKWMMTPRGTSFLYARRSLQGGLDPLVVSWGYEAVYPSESQFQDYHLINGTRDYTPYMTVPASIQFMEEQDWVSVASACRKMVMENATRLLDLLGTKPLTPIDERFVGQMFSAPIRTDNPEELHDILYDDYQVQIPVMRQGDDVYLRYSINGFNEQRDLDRLFEALTDLRSKGIIA